MSIQLKINKKMNLKVPEFVCDQSPLGEHLDKYDVLKHLNNYGFNAIVGKPGSGKTSLLISFLTGKGPSKVYRKVFDNVLLVMPNSSIPSMKKNVFKNHHEDKMFNELNFNSMDNIMNKLHSYTEEKENTLLILDDVGASLKNKELQKQLRELIYNRRHLKCQIIMLVQSFTSIPKEIRKSFTNIFMFKPSKVEFEK